MTRERVRKQRRAKILRRVAQPIHRLRGSLRQTFYGVAGQQRVIDAVIQAIAHEIVFATDIRRNQPRVCSTAASSHPPRRKKGGASFGRASSVSLSLTTVIQSTASAVTGSDKTSPSTARAGRPSI